VHGLAVLAPPFGLEDFIEIGRGRCLAGREGSSQRASANRRRASGRLPAASASRPRFVYAVLSWASNDSERSNIARARSGCSSFV
jgi:hypothetical protein